MKRNNQKKMNVAALAVAVALTSLVVAGGVGLGIAAAGGSESSQSSFGLATTSESAQATSTADANALASSDTAREQTVLTSTAQRDISQGIQAIEAQEEAERLAAEEAARAEEQARIEAAESAKAAQQAKAGQDAMASLSDVDWSVGKEAFIATWSERIDAYLSGSPLAGQGVTFATAAWNNGVDPRWSPAISNTESSKGANCFKSHNAWGWGQSGWSSWEEAINAHVAGLANGYGYTISYSSAKKYCPPNYDHWFSATLSEMKSI